MTDLCVMPHGTTSDGEPRRVQTVIGLLCERHRDQMDAHVTEIQNLIVDTMRIRDGGAPKEASPKTRHTKAAEAPAPGDLAIMALFDARTHTQRLTDDQSEPSIPVEHIAASWLLLLAEERPLTEALPKSLLGQLDLLVRHHDWMAGQSFVDDYLLELGELRKALSIAVRDRPVMKVGVCDLPNETSSACGGALLVENGAAVIKCARCRAAWVTPQEQARLAMRLA